METTDISPFEYVCTDQEIAFARTLALENDLLKAWQVANYPEHDNATCRREALKLTEQARISERVTFYRDQLARKLDIREDRILAELAAMGFSDPLDMFHPDGIPKNLTEIPAHARAAIKEYSIHEAIDGIHYTLKLHDKIKPLQMLINVKNMTRDRDAIRAPKVVLQFDESPKIVNQKEVIEHDTESSDSG